MFAFNARHFRDNKSYTEWQKYSLFFWGALARVPLSQWQFVVRLLLIICLSFNLARLFWWVVPLPVIPEAVASIVVSSLANGEDSINNPLININQLKSLPVFGKVGDVAQDAPVTIEPPSTETQLKLSLLGVITSNYNASARAIIDNGGQQELYAIGSTLPVGKNVSLAKVMLDRIIIKNNGQFESLFLYKNDVKAKPVVSNNSAPITPQMRQWLADHAEPEGEPPQTEAAQAEEIRSQQAKYKNEIAAKPVAIRQTGPVTPEMAQWLKDHAEPDQNAQENY